MLDIRLIASDIDGTIIPFGGTISQATIDIINECAEKGIMFALASGRCYPEAAKVAKAVKEAAAKASVKSSSKASVKTSVLDSVFEAVNKEIEQL